MRTKHSHKPNFGRRVEGCPRCAELAAGAEPVQSWRPRTDRNEGIQQRAQQEHFAPGGPHARGACGPVCTFGDW
ncbi:hypothetical protein [Streptomyces marincola]|uniref:Uncharacterized protein n=1 Tax=Streptomyces marincola TaxID=2878388 RepID=A0A1W7CZ88_9ACTN|nr:hypothetical protein [Streptomyces marincola]ARQ69979.1 hypothetical protein CAG99_14930 [Streptomyces marincola]